MFSNRRYRRTFDVEAGAVAVTDRRDGVVVSVVCADCVSEPSTAPVESRNRITARIRAVDPETATALKETVQVCPEAAVPVSESLVMLRVEAVAIVSS